MIGIGGKGGGSTGGGGMDALMGSPLMQTLTGRNTPPEMAGNSASLDPLAMLRGNADYWQNQRANVQQAGQNFSSNLQDLAQLFLGNQASQGGDGAMPLPEIMRPQRPPMVMTGRQPGLQQRPMTPPAQTPPQSAPLPPWQMYQDRGRKNDR